jgi:myo-inositol-1-phosphate synthase
VTRGMAIRVAIAGVGNATSVFIQGLTQYAKSGATKGLWHPLVAGLPPSELEVVAAFDIDSRKVGEDLSRAMFARPNVAKRFVKVPKLGVKVSPGLLQHDPPPHLKEQKLSTSTPAEVRSVLKKAKTDVFLNLISSGMGASSKAYALAALQAGASFVNCSPVILVKDKKLSEQFRKKGLVIVGDDLMSQFGGTVFHKGILKLMVDRGILVGKSYQLDVGGGSETFNTIDEEIKVAKREIKTSSVAGEVPYKFETVAGTTDYVDYMGNDRTSYFWFEGEGFLESGIEVDVYLRSSDGANAGNILLDVARAVSAAKSRGRAGAERTISGYGFKSPPRPVKFQEAAARFASEYL